MRSSWEASATNWRRRSSEADFSSKATSIWVSMAFRAEPRRPISVPGRPSGTRRVRSPEAMASAVPAIWRSGRRPRRTTTKTRRPMARSTARVALSSTLRSEARVSLVGFSEMEVTRVPWGTVTATVRYWPSGSPLLPSTTASGSGWNGAGVAPDAHPAPDVGHLLDGDVLGQNGGRVRMFHRSRGAGEDDLARGVEQLDVHVGRDAPREFGLADRQAALSGVGHVVEAEGLVLGQRVVGLAVEEGVHRRRR